MSTKVMQPRRRSRTLLSIATICAMSVPAAAFVAASPAFADEDRFANGKRVSQGAVAGDEPPVAFSHNDVYLQDGVGVTWEIYAASGATGSASDSGFRLPTVASTELGGTTEMRLTQAFNGYTYLRTFVGPGADRNLATYYNTFPERPTAECGGRQLAFAADVGTAERGTEGVTVSRKVYVPADAGYGRWTNTVTNTSNAAITTTLYLEGYLASYGETVVFGSSSGDAVATTADTWVGTFEDYDLSGLSYDPRIGHVLQGAGTLAPMIESTFADGSDTVEWAYELTLQPGQTRSIVNFAVLRGSKAEAAAAAGSIAANTPYSCMTHTEANQVANFIVGDRPTLTLPGNLQRDATGPNGANVTFSATAVDGNNQSIPVTCTPASGSVFAVGTTTVTCSATDAQGRKSTGTFTVTVRVVPECDGEKATIEAKPGVVTMGTSGKDVIVGTSAADTINSFGGNDVICGVDGNDAIDSGSGDDLVIGGAGADKIVAGRDNDEVHGETGNDILKGGRGRDNVTGDAGNDFLKGGADNDRVSGNGGKDRVVGNTGNDKVSGGAGKDQLNGNRGDDKVTSGGGDDQALGGPGQDVVDGVRG